SRTLDRDRFCLEAEIFVFQLQPEIGNVDGGTAAIEARSPLSELAGFAVQRRSSIGTGARSVVGEHLMLIHEVEATVEHDATFGPIEAFEGRASLAQDRAHVLIDIVELREVVGLLLRQRIAGAGGSLGSEVPGARDVQIVRLEAPYERQPIDGGLVVVVVAVAGVLKNAKTPVA